MLNLLTSVVTIFMGLLLGCEAALPKEGHLAGYNLGKPEIFFLPDTLREVSGLAYIDSTSLACVQDENGILFIYDILKKEIKNQYVFNMDGDYEGITRVGKTIYILRSDGSLFEIADYTSQDVELTTYVTGIPASDNEGLCYDRDNDRLLVACKGKIGKGHEFKDKRVIYGFDLKTKTLSKEPVFDFDLQSIKDFALSQNLDIPTKTKKKGQVAEPVIKFATSAVCIHPLTHKLYLLSAADHMLFVFDMKGNIEHIEALNKKMFNKPEGISFFENGDMLITNEGQDKKATLLRFRYGSKG